MTAARRRNDAGIALLVTLLAIVLVMALVWEIFHTGTRAAQSGAYGRDSIRAIALADAGIQAGKAILREDGKKTSGYESFNDIWALVQPPFELGDGTITLTIEDEDRKINLNRLVGGNRVAPDANRLAIFRRLLDILRIEPSVADAVTDWMDVDESPAGVGGAESSYYMSLRYPYKCKNDFFDTVEELRLVRGVTPDVFEKIRPYVTVQSSGKVNINTAPRAVIMALSAGQGEVYRGEIDEKMAESLVAWRQDHPFRSMATLKTDLAAVTPALGDIFGPVLRDQVDVRSNAFHLRATGDVGGTQRTIDTVGLRAGTVIQWRYWRLE